MQRLGPYIVLERLASGGLGEIYRGRRVGAAGFTKDVALKLVRPELARSAERIQDLIDEAKLASRLTHGCIAQTLDLLQVGEEWVVVEELVDGIDLFQLGRALGRHGRRLGQGEAVHITLQVLRALDFVHRVAGDDGRPLGLVHCDIAPANVMVNLGGEVKLVDFGTLRGAHLADVQGISAGGKLRYRAPEQMRGEPFDQRADLYSAGLLLWELLAGERVHEALSLEVLSAAVAEGRVPLVTALREDVPASLAEVVHRAIHPEPDLRYPSALAFAAGLEAQGIGLEVSRCGLVLGEIVAAVKAEAREPPPQLVSVADDRSLEASLVDALDP